MDPFKNYGFMTGGAFARNHGAHPKCGNQFRLLFWRVSHGCGPQQWNGEAEPAFATENGMNIRPPAPYATALIEAVPSEICFKSYYYKTILSRPTS